MAQQVAKRRRLQEQARKAEEQQKTAAAAAKAETKKKKGEEKAVADNAAWLRRQRMTNTSSRLRWVRLRLPFSSRFLPDEGCPQFCIMA